MNLKEIILNKIKKSPAPPFLFIGSGISQRYLGTPTWEGLLEYFSSIANEDNELAYHMYFDEAKRSNSSNGVLPKVAELLEADFNKKWFREEQFDSNRKTYKELIKKGVSPLKIEISDYIKSESDKPFINGLDSEIELLREAGNRSLGGIITTNYDCLIERILKDYKYNTVIGQEELIFSPITGVSEIYKIHGCCTSPNSIVINESDYEKFNERNAYLVAKLLTIFLEHPIIFIGYSISDVNIREILTSIAKCLPKEKLEVLKDRFIFIEWNNTMEMDNISDYEFSNLSDNKSILMTKVFVKDFSVVYEALLENKVKYNPRLIKKMKEDIYNVVLTSEPSKTINVLVDIEDDKLDEVETVVGFGVMKALGEKGYDGITAEDLFKDIIYEDGFFNNDLIVERSLPLILKYNQSIPVYKYISKYKGDLNEKLIKFKSKKYKDLLNKTIREKILREGYSTLSISELVEMHNLVGALKLIVYTDLSKQVDELLQYIKDYISKYPDILKGKNCTEKSEIRRLIKIYDYLKYKKEV
ncbi:SIR2 family protein [Clostridium perfringens]|uniref:SIR2 family protein n=1 Tax=Clostridium perfringens TaxID=1502 RepID=UPI002861EFCE|nr:SIR2 family protein [Clostridium perfringens]ELC8385725.1 SIR2 family protein [Clostridium perfringens]MDK0728106.1 SIR2 family protein [Clostridium perfringens]